MFVLPFRKGGREFFSGILSLNCPFSIQRWLKEKGMLGLPFFTVSWNMELEGVCRLHGPSKTEQWYWGIPGSFPPVCCGKYRCSFDTFWIWSWRWGHDPGSHPSHSIFVSTCVGKWSNNGLDAQHARIGPPPEQMGKRRWNNETPFPLSAPPTSDTFHHPSSGWKCGLSSLLPVWRAPSFDW